MDFSETRRHQRDKDKTTRWCRREHATTGTSSRHPLSEGRPLLAVSGSSWGPARCVVACSLGWCVVACHCGCTGDRGLFAPQSTCPRSSWPWACSVSNATSPSVSARLAHSRRTCCNRGCGTCVLGRFTHWGPPCSDGRRAATTA